MFRINILLLFTFIAFSHKVSSQTVSNSLQFYDLGKGISSPFNLGSIGVLAFPVPNKMALKVTKVQPQSPAEGKLFSGDMIIGANEKVFTDFASFNLNGSEYIDCYPLPQIGRAIDHSEGNGGSLKLTILRKGKKKELSLSIPAIGQWGDSFPFSSSKSDLLVRKNGALLVERQLPSGMWSRNGSHTKPSVITTAVVGMALLSADVEKYNKPIARAIKALYDRPLSDSSWNLSYRGMFYAEYFRQTKSKECRAKIDQLIDHSLKGVYYYNGVYGYGHKMNGGSYLYSGINICTVHMFTMLAMISSAGIDLPKNLKITIAKSIEKISPNNYINYKWSTEFSANSEKKTLSKQNQHSIRTGMGAFAFRLLGGRREHYSRLISFLFKNEQNADYGHAAGGPMAWFWSTVPLLMGDRSRFQEYMKNWSWRFSLGHTFDGSFYHQPTIDTGEYSSASLALGTHFRMATDIILLSSAKGNNLFSKRPTEKQLYVEKTSSSRVHYERMDRRVEISEAINLLEGHVPQEVLELQKRVKNIQVDDPAYLTGLQRIYKVDLKAIVEKTLSLPIADEVKNKAALALLGINHDIDLIEDSKKKRTYLNHLFTPANRNSYDVEVLIDGHMVFSKKVDYAERRNFKTFQQPWAIKDEGNLEVTFRYIWQGICLERKIKTILPLQLSWVKNVSTMDLTNFYGPFISKVSKFKPDGCLRVNLSGSHFECSMAEETEIHYKGIVARAGHFKKVGKYDFSGKQVRFQYQHSKQLLTKAVCLKIEILDEMNEEFYRDFKKASKSTKTLRGRWVDGKKQKNTKKMN